MKVNIFESIEDLPLPLQIIHEKSDWRLTLEKLNGFLSSKWPAHGVKAELPFYIDDTNMGNYQILPVAVQTWSEAYCRAFLDDLICFVESVSNGYYISLVPVDGEFRGYDVKFFYMRIEEKRLFCVPGESDCVKKFALT